MIEPFRTTALFLGLLNCTTAFPQITFDVAGVPVVATTIAQDLDVPWDLVLGPDGHLWFTEANGNVYRLDLATNDLHLVHTITGVVLGGFTAGLHSMAFHPDFADQPYIYFHYKNASSTSIVERFLYDAGSDSFGPGSGNLLPATIPAGASHNGSRLIADDEGNFILTMGDHMSGSANVQDLSAWEGKFLRFDPLGAIPADNPIAGSYVFNWGHRNPQGLVHASNGIWYNSAHGQSNDDEVNIVLPNRDYGWPTVLGLCNTTAEQSYCAAHDVVEPIHEFTSEIVAPAGIDHYDGTAIPGWNNSLLVATLRGEALWQLQLAPDGMSVTQATPYFQNTFGRLRDVQVLPDGRVVICTSNHDWAGTPGATDDRIILLTSSLSTGVGSTLSEKPVLSPNPAAGNGAWIDLPTDDLFDVRIMDAAGRTHSAHRRINGPSFLESTTLTAGTYLVVVNGNVQRWTLRWTVL